MAKRRAVKTKQNQPAFEYASLSVAAALIVFGLLFNWGTPVISGVILGLVAFYRLSAGMGRLGRVLRWLVAVVLVLSLASLLFYVANSL
jgi:hypothetical protein